MKIIKRNGSEEDFNIEKIINAVRKANNSSDSPYLTEEQIADVADYVEYKCNKIKRAVSVEEIQDMVEDQLMVGDSMMIAPIYRQNAEARHIYLPEPMTQVRMHEGEISTKFHKVFIAHRIQFCYNVSCISVRLVLD